MCAWFEILRKIKEEETPAPGTPVKDEKTGLLTNDQVDELAMQLEEKWEELASELKHIKKEGNSRRDTKTQFQKSLIFWTRQFR